MLDIEIQMWIVETENAHNQFCPKFQAQGHALQFGTFVETSQNSRTIEVSQAISTLHKEKKWFS